MKRALLLTITLLCALASTAQNWDHIRTSGEYYWGQGQGATEAEARQQALSQLTSMIATKVSNDFQWISDQTSQNGAVSHQEQVLNCVRTYSQATLTNVEWWPTAIGKEPNVAQRCWMAKSELHRIFEGRTAKALSMVELADEALQRNKVDVALQYYYWAYSLARSVQFPQEVKTAKGRTLVDWLPLKIDDVLSGIRLQVESCDGDRVNLTATYEGQPVSGLQFTYSDGRADCSGTARDGRAVLDMVPGHQASAYHVTVDYECAGLARGDSEVESVLAVVSRRPFPRAHFTLPATAATASTPTPSTKPVSAAPANAPEKPDVTATPASPDLLTEQPADYADIVRQVAEAITSRNYKDAEPFFTAEGRDMYNRLINYGKGRIIDMSQLNFYNSLNGRVVVRGLQMSFAFTRGTKKTFVENVAFTFNEEKKIENVAFGVGRQTEDNILLAHPKWSSDVREQIVEFLETYKTAYCLERLDYLRQVFADDAVIIVGHVAWKPQKQQQHDAMQRMSVDGEKIINYNRYDKDQYLNNLAKCFARQEFINIRFTNCTLQSLQKYKQKEYGEQELFAIQIGQDYNSTTYADMGYLFLLVDMTDSKEPQIHIRTWQPKEVDMNKIYNAGDFYK